MRKIRFGLGVGIISVLVGAFGFGIAGEAGADTNTGHPCTTARDCSINQYCHPFQHVCFEGDDQKCSFDSDCGGGGVVCHGGRCHKGNVQCFTNGDCISTQYCHLGICHAEACTTSGDCPAGVPCIMSRHVCGLP